ncbi:ribosomal RNA small subunit methyltransferase A [Candidatus Saccharibacteria bacterium]|nr:ribosomal RNA small subunit methyltransferase A [Candidatus Saccharibacteria bacterium]
MKNKKELGQNWLKNRAILDEIADYAVAGADEQSAEKIAEKKELCVEIGPGLGFLTSSLLKRFERVIAVEFDSELAQKLPGSFPGKNLTVVNEDVLKYDFDRINEPYTVAGNIPYYITSLIIKKLLMLKNKPERVVLLIQKEVAERIVDKKETVLSLFVKNYAKVVAGVVVPKEEFTPVPKVDSQVIIMEPYEKPVVGEAVFDLILTAFKAPRKKLVHNLAGFGKKEELFIVLNECGVSMDARPGDVDLKQWAELCKKLQ